MRCWFYKADGWFARHPRINFLIGTVLGAAVAVLTRLFVVHGG